MKRTSHVLCVLPLLTGAIEARADSLNGLRSSVARVGDVNGDGVPDLAVASRDRGRLERVWILSGKDGAKLLEVRSELAGDQFGSEIGALGDWDRDGVPDLYIASGRRAVGTEDSATGRRRLVSGKTGRVMLEFPTPGAFGGTVDLDGDGKLDILLGVASPDTTDRAAVVLSGDDGRELLRFAPDCSLTDKVQRITALAWMDDVDRDGRRDIVVASHWRLTKSRASFRPVEVRAVSGRTGSTLWSSTRNGDGETTWALVAGFGDTDGDGIGEILFAIEDDCAQVLDGKSGAIRTSILKPPACYYGFAATIDRLGDVHSDGVEDWIVGANESWKGFFDEGFVHIVSGRAGVQVRTVIADRDRGLDVCGLGDVSGDGVPDYAVGAEWRSDPRPKDDEPYLEVRSGKDASIVWTRQHLDLRK